MSPFSSSLIVMRLMNRQKVEEGMLEERKRIMNDG